MLVLAIAVTFAKEAAESSLPEGCVATRHNCPPSRWSV